MILGILTATPLIYRSMQMEEDIAVTYPQEFELPQLYNCTLKWQLHTCSLFDLRKLSKCKDNHNVTMNVGKFQANNSSFYTGGQVVNKNPQFQTKCIKSKILRLTITAIGSIELHFKSQVIKSKWKNSRLLNAQISEVR